ncbi:MAG: DUF1549 and DUF1553 domain-containing protein [Gemmataceae bacterium]|nr:DUF1549 and DUF1553 domain-containing protein [Gemmataceae bacterium]
MARRWSWAVVVMVVPAPSWADGPAFSARELAQRIDERLAAAWKAEQIQPAPPADDYEFLRRVYLDVLGRVPRVSEIYQFLDDPAPQRREKLIDRLLAHPSFIGHWSNTWRDIILPTGGNQQAVFFANNLRTWLEQQIKKDVPFDQMVRNLLAAPTTLNQPPRGQFTAPANQVNPLAYLQAHEFKAENLASSTARVFLGVRLECAQCHDHPFAKWSQTNFWELAAFFSGVGLQNRFVPPNQPQPAALKNPGKEIKIPGKEKIVAARFPTGELPIWDDAKDPRAILAEWVTSRNNPYFARTAANRVWAHCFGIGLLDPCDDEPTEDNPIRHPELLAELTQQLIAHNFDLKFLLRAILNSRAYQRSSAMTHPSQKDLQSFARMPIRGLTPEQLWDSLTTAVGYRPAPGQLDPRLDFLNNQSIRAQLLARFALPERRTETQTSILQALALMNGKFISDATSLRTGELLAGVADFPAWSAERKLETLFLATVSRPPRAEERDRLLTYVQRGGARGDEAAALADVFWALLNSSEFLFNH